ncbi:hypothetical protein OEG84_25100 [Hoeflea sp. G2-23]|uniref:Uncharacterized protein n=1 Tax=Hoeflea algicola TaxID=2983763 RepID=A0ABT3ZGZ8_9HYPH|nr:hypothetical protein [Hoeflea algicola]MCY0150886.1 hypothetical protein [Hoeflea algicola]
MLEAAVAELNAAQLEDYKRAAAYVALVTICEPEDAERRFDLASEVLKSAGITKITVPDIQAVIEGSSGAPKDMACALMDASDVNR